MVEIGRACRVGLDSDHVRSYPTCRTGVVDIRFTWPDEDAPEDEQGKMHLVIEGLAEGCHLWQYVDVDGEPQSEEFCVGPDIGTGTPCGH